MGSLKWKKCLGSLKKAVFALFLIVSPKKGIKKAKNDGQNGTCNWFLPGKAVFFWWWHPPLIGGGPWVHPRGHPDTPTPSQTPFLPSGTSSTTLDTVPVERGSDGAPFFRFFSFNPWPSTPPCIPLQCLVQMVLSYGITGDVDIDASLTINNVNYFIHQTDKLA